MYHNHNQEPQDSIGIFSARIVSTSYNYKYNIPPNHILVIKGPILGRSRLCLSESPTGGYKDRENGRGLYIWAVVIILVPFWVPNIVRQLLFRVLKKGPQF